MVDVSLLCGRMVHVWCWGGVGRKNIVIVQSLLGQSVLLFEPSQKLSCYYNDSMPNFLDLTKVLNRTGGVEERN